MKYDNFFIKHLSKNDMVAAPLAGISNLPFRRVLRKFFDGIIYSEMISVEGILRKDPDSLEYLDRIEDDSPLVFQLFGGKPSSYTDAVKVATDYTKVDAFDINMGCPVKKVIKAGGGCSLLDDLNRLKDIVKAVRNSTTLPFSIKIRVGLDIKRLVYREILSIAEGEGVDALSIHARTKSDMFGGTIHYNILEEVTSIAKIPIIGNGGVIDQESYLKMKSTGVNGIMIGRGIMKSPWIFQAIKENKPIENFIKPKEIHSLLTDMHQYMLEHACGKNNKNTHYMHILRKFAVWFSKGIDNAAEFRTDIYKTQNIDVILNIMKDFFNK